MECGLILYKYNQKKNWHIKKLNEVSRFPKIKISQVTLPDWFLENVTWNIIIWGNLNTSFGFLICKKASGYFLYAKLSFSRFIKKLNSYVFWAENLHKISKFYNNITKIIHIYQKAVFYTEILFLWWLHLKSSSFQINVG